MRDIPGFEGRYAITSCGKVWSYRTKRFLKPYDDTHGYLKVDLRKGDKRCQCKVHRLVAITYLPNPDNLPQVNHKDENKQNNCLNNLEWCDAKYNNNYGTKVQRQVQSLVGDSLIEVRKKDTNELIDYFISQSAAARELGISQCGISLAIKRNGSAGGYRFRQINIQDVNQ